MRGDLRFMIYELRFGGGAGARKAAFFSHHVDGVERLKLHTGLDSGWAGGERGCPFNFIFDP